MKTRVKLSNNEIFTKTIFNLKLALPVRRVENNCYILINTDEKGWGLKYVNDKSIDV